MVRESYALLRSYAEQHAAETGATVASQPLVLVDERLGTAAGRLQLDLDSVRELAGLRDTPLEATQQLAIHFQADESYDGSRHSKGYLARTSFRHLDHVYYPYINLPVPTDPQTLDKKLRLINWRIRHEIAHLAQPPVNPAYADPGIIRAVRALSVSALVANIAGNSLEAIFSRPTEMLIGNAALLGLAAYSAIKPYDVLHGLDRMERDADRFANQTKQYQPLSLAPAN